MKIVEETVVAAITTDVPAVPASGRAGTAIAVETLLPQTSTPTPANASCSLTHSTTSAGAPRVRASGWRSYGQVLLDLPVAELPALSGRAQ